ncbi:MAG: glycosyltransferase, partial [Candidatus Ratteibacteria bacterium]
PTISFESGYIELLKKIKEKNIPLIYLKEKDKIETNFEKIFVLHPSPGKFKTDNQNSLVLKILKNNLENFKNVQIIHISGFLDFKKVEKEYEKLILSHKIFPYFQEIEKLYTISDLVISRAGAMTISELIHFKKPAILIPLPTAAELHQNWNAEFLKKYNCVEVIYQRKNWEEKLYKKIIEFINNKSLLYKMSLGYKDIPKPQT